MLFFTNLVLTNGLKASELKDWALDIVRYSPVFQSEGEAGLPEEYRRRPTRPALEQVQGACGCDFAMSLLLDDVELGQTT